MLPVWISSILAIFGWAETELPSLEKIIAGIGTYLGGFFSSVFGKGSQTVAIVKTAVNYAEDAVMTMDGYTVEAEQWLVNEIKNQSSTIKSVEDMVAAVLAIFPNLDKELFARFMTMTHLVGAAQQAGNQSSTTPTLTMAQAHGPAAHLVHSAHGNIRAAAVKP